jgi:transposase-like protein
LLYLAPRNITKKWRNVSREWLAALPHFAVLFGDRMLVEP